MTKAWRKVTPEDFDVAELLKAAREGRLYVAPTGAATDSVCDIEKVRAYVERLRPFVIRKWHPFVAGLWERMLADDDFRRLLSPSARARKSRDFDKYQVYRIVGILREKGVYEQYSDRRFDALLEPSVADSPYRRYLGMGLEERSLLIKIRQIVADTKL
jgi:hypothetical protein